MGRGGPRQQQQAGGERATPPPHIAAALRAVLRISCAVALIARTSANSTMPRPSASARSPRLVSKVIAVVIVRVTPAMLPPTIRIAPTSAAALPTPASTAVTTLKRPSHKSEPTVRTRPTPSPPPPPPHTHPVTTPKPPHQQERPDGPPPPDPTHHKKLAITPQKVFERLPRDPGDVRRDQDGLGDDHRGGGENQAKPAE